MQMIPWMIVVVAGVAALALFLRARALGVELAEGEIDREKLRGELAASRAQLEKASAKARQRGDELGELRKKLDKQKRRAAPAKGTAPAAGAARVGELEQELETARQARDAAREEATGLSAELSRLRAQLAERATPPPAAVEAQPAETPLLVNDAITALQRRVDEAEQARGAAQAELVEARKQTERLKGKARTQEVLYASIRSELEAKKDRLRTQQEELERLQALKVAVIDPIPEEGAG
jgi:predicted  nucleic acid-binding Zn-ribbon protein